MNCRHLKEKLYLSKMKNDSHSSRLRELSVRGCGAQMHFPRLPLTPPFDGMQCQVEFLSFPDSSIKVMLEKLDPTTPTWRLFAMLAQFSLHCQV